MSIAGARAPSVIGPEGVDVRSGPSTDGGVSASAGTDDSARTELAPKEAHPEQDGAQRALLLEQAKKAAARLAELMGELAETKASTPPEEAGLEERLRAAAAVLQTTGPECQVTESISAGGERSLVVGVLRAGRREPESQWRCKVPTCAERYHPLIECLQFLIMTPGERMDVVTTASLCWGCLTPGHGAAVRTCPFREELRGLCAKRRCKQSHHQLLHMEGKPELHSYRHPRRSASEPVEPLVHIVAATARLSDQPPAQLVTQRIRTAAGEPCVTF